MAALTDHMFNTALVAEMLTYLKTSHAITAAVLDSDGRVVSITGHDHTPLLPASRLFPFAHDQNIGSLACSAASDTLLAEAEPHIRISLRVINELLLREIELQQTADEMLQLSEQLHFLFNLAKKIAGCNRLQDFCAITLAEIAQAIDADQAFINIKSLWNDRLRVTHNITRTEMTLLEKEEAFLTAPAKDTVLFSLVDGTSTLLASIKEKGGCIGHMVFLRHHSRRFFTSYEKKFVGIINSIISPSIETMRLYNSLQDLYLNTVKALAAAIDAKDEYTHGHSFRVAKYSVAIGHKIGFSSQELADLEIAAYMHDLGKIGIPEAILSKPGRLTEAEFSEIKKHPVLTDKILQPINLPDFIVDAAIHHHERLDGSGYPHGLDDKHISPFARVIAVADVFDALTSDRPYRQAMPVETAIEVLCNGIGHHFDRRMVLALVTALADHEADETLSVLYRILKFTDFHNLNQFLVQISELLIPGAEDEGLSAQPPIIGLGTAGV
ncbi:MAG: HD-GYP domain-containing protein [Desulfobulbaceae bacterium]|nr:HD-GYP domain-containing protein [Desulfobulbaceae bacterium]